MTSERHNLIAFLAIVLAIVILAFNGKGTDLAIMTGLVGVLGTFRPKTAPVAQTDSGDVNVGSGDTK